MFDTDIEGEYDPFGAFDAANGVGQVRDPYPVLRELREECPVHVGPTWPRFGVDRPAEAMLIGDATPYTVMPFDAVQHVLKKNEAYSSSLLAKITGVVMGHTIIEMDEPEHHRNRALVQKAFSPKAMERWEAEVVAPIVARHIDEFADTGRAELVRELFWPFPTHVIGEMLGLPREDLPHFSRKAAELIGIITDVERGMAASQWLYDYFAAIIAARREEPRGDIISTLIEAELDGERLTDVEIVTFLRLLLPAGAETTYRSSSNLMFGLLSNPEQLAAVRDDRSLVARAVEEGLRWEAPITSLSRLAILETEVEGTSIPAGAPVMLSIGGANRDPARWAEPDRFDIFREPQGHMAFGFGSHICLGMHLARMEMRVALNAVLDRLVNLRFDPEAGDLFIRGLSFRAPSELPVLFDTP